jgi:hypothetical protein
LEVSAHSDQSRGLIDIDMDIGIKGPNNEPQGKNRMAEKSVRMGIVHHAKGDDDIKGTIEVIATFDHARSPRPGPSTQPIAAQLRLRRRTSRDADVRPLLDRQPTVSERKARPRGPG